MQGGIERLVRGFTKPDYCGIILFFCILRKSLLTPHRKMFKVTVRIRQRDCRQSGGETICII